MKKNCSELFIIPSLEFLNSKADKKLSLFIKNSFSTKERLDTNNKKKDLVYMKQGLSV